MLHTHLSIENNSSSLFLKKTYTHLQLDKYTYMLYLELLLENTIIRINIIFPTIYLQTQRMTRDCTETNEYLDTMFDGIFFGLYIFNKVHSASLALNHTFVNHKYSFRHHLL